MYFSSGEHEENAMLNTAHIYYLTSGIAVAMMITKLVQTMTLAKS